MDTLKNNIVSLRVALGLLKQKENRKKIMNDIRKKPSWVFGHAHLLFICRLSQFSHWYCYIVLTRYQLLNIRNRMVAHTLI